MLCQVQWWEICLLEFEKYSSLALLRINKQKLICPGLKRRVCTRQFLPLSSCLLRQWVLVRYFKVAEQQKSGKAPGLFLAGLCSILERVSYDSGKQGTRDLCRAPAWTVRLLAEFWVLSFTVIEKFQYAFISFFIFNLWKRFNDSPLKQFMFERVCFRVWLEKTGMYFGLGQSLQVL